MLCRIADFDIDIDYIHPRTKIFLKDYINPDKKKADFVIKITEEDIDREVSGAISSGEKLRYSRIYLERLAILRKISAELLRRDGFLMHGAVIEYEGKGYLFGAVSRTGKTTHILLWQELFGKENVRIINGDKPFIRYIDGRFYAYGTPWCGKEGFNVNARVELSRVCFVKRAKQNSIEKLDETEALRNIFPQIMITDSSDLAAQIDLVGAMLEKVPMYAIYCNKDIEAAKVAYEGMK